MGLKHYAGLAGRYIVDKAKGIGRFIENHAGLIGNLIGVAGNYVAPGVFNAGAALTSGILDLLPENRVTKTLKNIADGAQFKNLYNTSANEYKSSESRTVPGEGMTYGQGTAPRQMGYNTDWLYEKRKGLASMTMQKGAKKATIQKGAKKVRKRVKKRKA